MVWTGRVVCVLQAVATQAVLTGTRQQCALCLPWLASHAHLVPGKAASPHSILLRGVLQQPEALEIVMKAVMLSADGAAFLKHAKETGKTGAFFSPLLNPFSATLSHFL